jgi:hypothetical protein
MFYRKALISFQSFIKNKFMNSVIHVKDLLSTEYIRLLNEKQVLLDWGKPQLESLYLLHIGQHQIRKLNAEIRVMALKRKIELVTAAINTGKEPDLVAIETQVASELAEVEQKIMEASNAYAKAVVYVAGLDSPERSAELRKVFCRLAKKLHPDVIPEVTEWHAALWLRVKKAYDKGDLEQLLALEVVYRDELIAETVEDELLSSEQIEKLKLAIRQLEEEIVMIRSSFPFTHEELLYNEEWILAQQEKLELEIENLRIYECQLQTEFENLLHE